MDRLLCILTCGLVALAAGGCAHLHDVSPCTGGCCDQGLAIFDGLAGSPCGQCPAGACDDCGGDPCTCGVAEETCAAPVCESCAMPAATICKPNLLHAFFGCTGCDGEYYWSEWFSDPPACHDPCDDCGNWTGHAHPAGHVIHEGAEFMASPAATKSGCACGRH